jgi:DNA-nicking Smr family endonuclease
VNDEDKELFRRAMADARPLKPQDRAEIEKQKPRPGARFRRADDEAALRESLEADVDDIEADSGEALRFGRPSVGKRTLRRLARGHYAVQAEIDLHGMTVAEARPRLRDFIAHSAQQGLRCVRVVHGKGLGSGERGPVLRPSVNRWLRRWDDVLAFVSTPRVHGGTGAVYVLLRDR